VPQAFDYHAPLISLALAFGTTLATIPATIPYLWAEPRRVKNWAARIGGCGFKIGICWQGAASIAGRSFPLAALAPISQIGNVRLISLQKDGAAEIAATGLRMEDLGDDFDTGRDGFLDSAAVMESLDLVITADTALAHLAGALGRPTWVALRYVPDWRWFLGRSDSPWYPQLRLFRQPAPGDWAAVMAEMETQLRAMALS
jgi:ADP-heptose:LPS heptosyltransferase